MQMVTYGSATTININRASSSFRHTITYSFSELTGTIATKTSSTSIGWTIPTSFYAKIPDSKSGKVTITCDTYSGDTKVGSSSTTANVFVINSEPTVDATIEDVNENTVALTGDSNKIVRYMSNAQVDISATAKNSATIKSRKVVCGSKSGTSTSNTLNNVESGTFVVSCTDSRGFSASKTTTKTLIEYVKLAFIDISLTRPTTTSNTVNAVIRGNWFNGNFGTTNNTLSMKYRYRQSGGSWGSYRTVTPTKNGNTFSYNASLGSTYNFNYEYEFEFVIEDKLMTVTQDVIVTQGEPIIDVGKNDVVINGEVYIRDINVEEKILVNTRDNVDLDDLTETGTYFVSNPYNAPEDVSNGWVQVYESGMSPIKQIFYNVGIAGADDFKIYTRTKVVSSWSDWTLINVARTGDIIVTSRKFNPSNYLGGEWELIDKEFEPYRNSDEDVSINSSNTSSASVVVVRQGHTVMLRVEFENKVSLDDSTHDILTFKQSTFGAKDSDIYWQRYFIGQTDGGNGLLNMYLTSDRVLSVRDVVTKASNGTIASGNTCMVTINWEIPYDYMDDDYCNKFYWKKVS